MIPVLSKINPTLSFFFTSNFFFNFFFFYIQSNLKAHLEFLYSFFFLKVATYVKTAFLGQKSLTVGTSQFLIKKTYKSKIYKKNLSLKLKSFFFLKNIKKIKKIPFINKKIKNEIIFHPHSSFESLNFFKNNKISFTGLPFFKNYNKFYYTRRVLFPKHFSRSLKKIKSWKFKKLLKFFKRNNKNKNYRFYFFVKKMAYILFADSDNFFYKDKKNYIKIKNLTNDYKRYDNFFFLSPVKYFFFKRKFFLRSFRNFRKIRRKSKKIKFKILSVKNLKNLKKKKKLKKRILTKALTQRKLNRIFLKFKLKLKTISYRLKKKIKKINLLSKKIKKKDKKLKLIKKNRLNLKRKFELKLKIISRKMNRIRYRIRKHVLKKKRKNRKYGFKKIYSMDYRLSKFRFANINQFSSYSNSRATHFHLNNQKLKNLYKNDFFFNSIQTSSNFYLNYYKFFFFQQNKLKKKKKKKNLF